eukprot:TRINITY_DN4746_c0_g2_i1.p1 TRINITY_DN4746_c0_g2~~TRINITY_DN4746_c0_g2_i1.p1  ORF type:complete len:570 (-),score=72.78 TRINITY_DN4746_c0_g2_i1:323-2032(-)
MERDQCVARDFLGLAANSAAEVKRRGNKDAANTRSGGEGDTGMHGSGKPQGGVHRPAPVSIHDGGGGDASAAARLRQMSEPSGLNNTTSAFNNGGRAFRGPVFNGSLPSAGINMKGSPVPGLPSMPDYQQGQWTALEKVQSFTTALAQAQAQAHTNFAFDRSSLKELKERGNYVSREDIAHGNYEAQLAMAASQAQFAAVSRRFASPTQGARPIDDRNTMARPGERSGMMESSLSLSIAGPREHHVPVPSFRVPPATAGTPANGTIQGAMAAPRPPVSVAANGSLANGVVKGPSAANASGRLATAQLTIFYAGSVNVYDDVPADKAQAIMLLAGSGSSWSTSIINAPPLPSSLNTSSMAGSQVSKQEMSVSSTSSPVSQQIAALRVQAHTSASQSALQQPASGSSGSNQASVPAAAPNQHEAAAAVAAAASVPNGPRRKTELPHARKVSMARYLEKRRERSTTSRQKAAYPEKPEGSPQRPQCPSPGTPMLRSPPRSMVGSPPRTPDGANPLPATSQAEESQQINCKAPMQVDEPERVEEGEGWSKPPVEQKRSQQESPSSPIKASLPM